MPNTPRITARTQMNCLGAESVIIHKFLVNNKVPICGFRFFVTRITSLYNFFCICNNFLDFFTFAGAENSLGRGGGGSFFPHEIRRNNVSCPLFHKSTINLITFAGKLYGLMGKVLIDLSILKHLNCGLGQVAYNYAKYYQSHAKEFDYEVHLLVPKSFVNAFGQDVHYHVSREIHKIFPFLLPHFDVWHTIHQLARQAPSRRSTRNLLTIHDLNFLYEKEGKTKEKYIRKLTKKIKRANRITCISNFAKNDVEKNFQVGQPIEVIYNGVEFMSPTAEKQPVLPCDADKKFLFTIGQLLPKKNFHTLLDVMKLMPEYNLIIAGKDTTEYAKMIKDRIADEGISNVFLLGEILHGEKVWLYNHCEAFVFPSLFEGFGLPIIEAMFFGKPVVSSDKTSLKEIGADHVFFWESFEPEHMAARIREAIAQFGDNPSMALDNKAYAESYSYEKHLTRYNEIYRELMGEK